MSSSCSTHLLFRGNCRCDVCKDSRRSECDAPTASSSQCHKCLLLGYKNHHFCTSDPITYPGSEGENKNMSARDTRQRSGKDKPRTGAGFRFQTEQDPESPALLTTRPLTGSKKSAIQASPRINQQSPAGTTPRVGGLASTDLKLDQGNPSAAMFTSSD